MRFLGSHSISPSDQFAMRLLVALVIVLFSVNVSCISKSFVGGVFFPDFEDKPMITTINLGLKWFDTCETNNENNTVRISFIAPDALADADAPSIFYSQNITGNPTISFNGVTAWTIESKIAHYAKGVGNADSPVGFAITAYTSSVYLSIENFTWTLTRITKATSGKGVDYHTGDLVASGYFFNCQVPDDLPQVGEGCPQDPCDANCNVGGKNAGCGDFYGNY